jgi:uncharacterized membrane protein YdbT with pleckstrin-like domain
MPPQSETPVWNGTPSQWLNFGAFFLCALFAAAIVAIAIISSKPVVYAGLAIPAAIALTKWLKVRSYRITVTTERITTQTGVFSRHRSDMELYRVKDTTLHEPFLLRLVGLANIAIESSDRTTPSSVLPAIHSAEDLRQKIRANVERLRTIKGIREMDMDVER